MKKVLILLLTVSFITSCATREEIVYFQNAENLEGMENLLEYEPVIQKNDVLRINVSSQNELAVQPFQQNSGNQSGSGGGGQNLSLTGYLVDPSGNIQFPLLGEVTVAGKTRGDIQKFIQERVRNYVTDGVVDVRIVNFTVSFLGEINARIDVNDGRISIPQAIAQAGGVPYTAKRQNILVIREVDGVKSIGTVDLTKTDIFSSPYYYLKQNDIVYVEPTYRQVKSAGFITSYTGLLSIGTTILSLILLLSR